MRVKLEQRLAALLQEGDQLAETRERLVREVNNIDIRMHQLRGALSELEKLIEESKNDITQTLDQQP